ncbi:uncharacterized protein LOC106665682 [Cimex lectularius]|uniref:Uncharacterized protein n=1 Tax=Cimex lectularius TaxID=79782 RepID=A0A8I6RM84_CIMLE|nr:uncharacterized protein LOC106665682 [Cimex lectularius]
MIAENYYSTSCQPEEKNEEVKSEPLQENKNVSCSETEFSTSIQERPAEASFEECEQFVSNFWSKITKRAEPKKEKGWFEKYILEDVKKCYTPSAATSYYQYHRRVEGDCDDACFNPGNDHPGPAREMGTALSESDDKCTRLFCPRLFCYNRHPRTLMCCLAKLLTAAFQLIAIGAACYFLHKWWNLRAEYNAIIKEVREAQNERILLENELMSVQNNPRGENTLYDEIGDTKRQIMLGEIERISQYLIEAKNEIISLMEDRDRLKMELRQAIEEKNNAKQTFNNAVNCIVHDETQVENDEIECACPMLAQQTQSSSPRKANRSTSI